MEVLSLAAPSGVSPQHEAAVKQNGAGAAVKPQTYILELLGSHLVWDTAYPDRGFSDFPQSLQINSTMLPQLG
jgi:hypothetical protein